MPREILKTKFSSFEPRSWKGQSLYEYFPRIKSFVANRYGKDYEALFAQPKLVRGADSYISWLTEETGRPFIALKELPEAQQEQINLEIASFKGFMEQLQSAGNRDDREWGQLLSLCCEQVSDESIFFDGQTLVIAAWGLRPFSDPDFKPFSALRARPFERQIPPPVPMPLVTDEEGGPAESESEDLVIEELEDSPAEPLNNLPAMEDPLAGFAAPDEPTQGSDFPAENSGMVPEEEDPDEKEPPEEVPPPPGDDPPEDSFWSFLKRWWWLFLLLLLALIGAFRFCERTVDHLPPQPNVPFPIDTTQIMPDQDSIRLIAGDRLNILIKDSDPDFKAFARDFKAAYPAANIKIIAYDTMLKTLQVQVPPEDREQLIEEIPERMSSYRLLVWHESMFERFNVPSDPDFQNQDLSWYFKPIQAEEAWGTTYGDDDLIIAVIDDGFDLTHPELSGKVVNPFNVINRNQDVLSNPKAQHGSHVAGTAVGNRDNGEGLSGIAPDCKLMPIQVADDYGNISQKAVIDGIVYAILNGADVINLSLGMSVLDPSGPPVSIASQQMIIRTRFLSEERFWNDLFEFAEENEVAVVMAAGNDNVLTGLDPMQRSPLGIKVSAVDPQLNRASFSNFGSYSTISAPGVQIWSSVPGGGFVAKNGTSMAAPMVAGAVAIARTLQPDLSPAEIRRLLVRTAKPLSDDIGPLLQMGAMIDELGGGGGGPSNEEECLDIQFRIDSLQRLIDELKGLCPDLSSGADTMKMPEVIKDLDFTIGRWKSTTNLYNFSGEKVVIYFDFFGNQAGKITLVEPGGMQCSADLNMQSGQSSFEVDQLEEAYCTDNNQTYYYPYEFTCSADANGYATCTAQNKVDKPNRFDFKLVKIK